MAPLRAERHYSTRFLTLRNYFGVALRVHSVPSAKTTRVIVSVPRVSVTFAGGFVLYEFDMPLGLPIDSLVERSDDLP